MVTQLKKGTKLRPKFGRKWSQYNKLEPLEEVELCYNQKSTDSYVYVKITKGSTYNKETYSHRYTGDHIYINLDAFVPVGTKAERTEKLTVWF